MRLRNGIHYEGIAQDGSHSFFAFIKDPVIGEYIERLKVYGYSKSQSFREANRYFNKFNLSI